MEVGSRAATASEDFGGARNHCKYKVQFRIMMGLRADNLVKAATDKLAVGLGVVAVSAIVGALLSEPSSSGQEQLARVGRESETIAATAVSRIQRAAAIEATAAASLPQLRAALRARVDTATLEDLFATEDWWLPYRDRAVAVVSSNSVLVSRAAADLQPETDLSRRALAAGTATAVKKSGHAVVIAGAAAIDGVPGGAVVTLARPFDAGLLADLARAGGAALALSDGERVLATSDGWTEQPGLAGHEQDLGGVTDGAHLAVGGRLDSSVWLWVQRPLPRLPQGHRWLWLLVACAGAVGAAVAVVTDRRRTRREQPVQTARLLDEDRAERVPHTVGMTGSGADSSDGLPSLVHRGERASAVSRTVASAETLIVRGPGQMFGRYELMERIGEGGMSEVYLASMRGAEGFQRILVVKRLRPALAQNRSAVDQFIDEARLGSLLTHPNVVQVFDFGKVDDGYYMALEYVPGRNVAQIVKRHIERMGGPLDVSTVFYLAHEVLQALEYAHGRADDEGECLGIVHRDVSPGNIVISTSGDVKLIDFGIVKAESRVSRTNLGNVKGNPAFMAPEQARGKAVDARSDLFSLGLVMYYALTGHVVYNATAPADAMYRAAMGLGPEDMARVNSLPGAAAEVIARALSFDAADRFPDAQSFASTIERELVLGARAATAALINTLFAEELRPPAEVERPRRPVGLV